MIIQFNYIAVKQRQNEFYITKVNAYDLKKIVDFHFREPYKEYSNYINKDFEKIKKELEQSDINISNTAVFSDGTNTVQRAVNAKRVNEIKSFISEDETAFFPNSVLLAIDTSRYDKDFELSEQGFFKFDSDYMSASIIDGQHRLAGIFLCEDSLLKEMEIPVIFLIDISIATASILFQQINGKQKQVSKSVLYDLFENINPQDNSKNDDIETKNYHLICQSFFFDKQSPFFRQIKMLGTGSGAISQAFFIETCKSQLECIKYMDNEGRYDILFDFFKKVQLTFSNDWPVPLDISKYTFTDLDKYASNILKYKKSQLAKTNGFFALVKLFSYMYLNGFSFDLIENLKGKIDWYNIEGTGKKAQNILYDKLKNNIDK